MMPRLRWSARIRWAVPRARISGLSLGGRDELVSTASWATRDKVSVRSDDRREFGLQHLERDIALVAQVAGQVYRRHRALAELALDAASAI